MIFKQVLSMILINLQSFSEFYCPFCAGMALEEAKMIEIEFTMKWVAKIRKYGGSFAKTDR